MSYQRPKSLATGNGPWLAWLIIAVCVMLPSCSFSQTKPEHGIAILLSDGSPAFAGVEREIAKKYPSPIKTYNLDHNESLYSDVQKKIQSSDQSVVIAIGLPAARVARGLSGKKVIFCQVFNYEEENMVTPWMKGVSAIAPEHELFRAWKRLYPRLTRVGVITGKNLRGLVIDAKAAARNNGIKLIHFEVVSDKETLYAYKQLTPKIQGLWLVPDNRVLSRNVIRDIMAHSVKEGKQVAVFSRELLGLGGIVSAETGYADIAEQVLSRVRQAEENAGVPGAPIIPLTRAIIRINTIMAKRLNLTIPKTLRRMAYAP